MGWTPPPITASMCRSGSVINDSNSGSARHGDCNDRLSRACFIFRFLKRPLSKSRDGGWRERPEKGSGSYLHRARSLCAVRAGRSHANGSLDVSTYHTMTASLRAVATMAICGCGNRAGAGRKHTEGGCLCSVRGCLVRANPHEDGPVDADAALLRNMRPLAGGPGTEPCPSLPANRFVAVVNPRTRPCG
ncbi:hypothetical protein J2797_005617 [Paraburkholderia terricola]|nr:hypothetical protein [Paraburkholderia terricola]